MTSARAKGRGWKVTVKRATERGGMCGKRRSGGRERPQRGLASSGSRAGGLCGHHARSPQRSCARVVRSRSHPMGRSRPCAHARSAWPVDTDAIVTGIRKERSIRPYDEYQLTSKRVAAASQRWRRQRPRLGQPAEDRTALDCLSPVKKYLLFGEIQAMQALAHPNTRHHTPSFFPFSCFSPIK